MKNTVKVFSCILLLIFMLFGCEGDDPSEANNQSQLIITDPPGSDTPTDTPDVVPKEPLINFSLAIEDNTGTASLNVNQGNPVKVSATLLIGDQPQAGVLVAFSLQYGLAVLDPESGTALTDANGVASIVVSSGEQEGADTITASTNGLSASKSFSVSVETISVSMSQAVATPASISAKGATSISVMINDDSNSVPYGSPVSVSFTSACIEAGLATVVSPVITVNGYAQTTYKDITCGQEDVIEVNAKVGNQLLASNVSIDVQNADAGSMNFIGASNEFIALQGTGGSGTGSNRSETSSLTFQVMDISGSPAANEQVLFEFTSNIGNLSLLFASSQTDANGYVDVIVTSGNVATTVRVVATLASNTSISTISDLLVVSSGVADYNSFSISVSDFNPEAWLIDGIKVQVNAYVADHFNNPVPDGTAISFTTEFGQIEQSCVTTNGHCSVNWTSSAPRTPIPAFRSNTTQTRRLGDGSICLKFDGSNSMLNDAFYGFPCFYTNAKPATNTDATMPGGLGQVYGNRVTIFAHMMGEESFADTNGNGVFDAGEAYTDIASEGYRDDNEDGVFAGSYSDGSLAMGAQAAIDACDLAYGTKCLQAGGDNEEYFDFNNDGSYNGLGNNLYNGVLCKDAANGCTKTLLPISRNITILQAGSWPSISLIENGLDREDVDNYFNTVINLSGGTKTITAYVADLHNGRMPSGTSITFSASNGTIVGPSSCTVLNSSALGFESCSVVLKNEIPDEVDLGPLTVRVTTPSGAVTETSILIED